MESVALFSTLKSRKTLMKSLNFESVFVTVESLTVFYGGGGDGNG